jgi:Spy/CpxP family protein refolding chaperone
MTTTSSIFRKPLRKLSIASLMVAMAVPAGLSAQPRNPDAGVADNGGQRGLRGQRGQNARGGRHGHHGRGQDGVMRQLNLSDAQREQLRTIRQETRAQAEQLRQANDRDAVRALHRAARLRVEAVLTPAQRQQAETLRQQARAEHVARRVSRMRERLSLTDAQAAAVQGVFEQASARRHAARQGAGQGATREERQATRQAARQQVDAELARILTPAQMTQLQAEREARRGQRGEGRGPRGRGQRGGAGRGAGPHGGGAR